MTEAKKRPAQKKPAAKKAEAPAEPVEVSIGGEGSPYTAVEADNLIEVRYKGLPIYAFDATFSNNLSKGFERWIAPVRREFALCVSSAVMARNLHANLVYSVPIDKMEGELLKSGILVGMSFDGSLVEQTATVSFDAGALDGDDALDVVRGNCDMAARNLVESVVTSRLRP